MELGDCCLTEHRGLTPKADRLMSRYRPIAPKPIALTVPTFADTNRAVSSVNSLETYYRAVPDPSRNRRVRKRRGDSLTPPQARKKVANSCGKSDCNKEHSSLRSCSAGSCLRVEAFDEVVGAVVDPFSRGCLFTTSGSKGSMATVKVEMPDTSVLKGATVISEAEAICTSRLVGNNLRIWKDTGFMTRAAGISPPYALSGREIPTFCSGEFTEMIRGITRLSKATELSNLISPSPMSTMQSNSCNLGEGTFAAGAVPLLCAALVDGEHEMMAVEQQQRQQQDKDGNTDLVTLPLLPGSSMRSGSSSSSTSSCSSLTQAHEFVSWKDTSDARCRSSCNESRACSSEEYDYPKDSPRDTALIRQIYGSSREPVLLVGDSQNVLWYNHAYERAIKGYMDRQASKTTPVVPFIDPLGIPTQLGRFTLQFPVCGSTCATLWGFLKKFVVDAGTETPDADSPVDSSLKELKLNRFLDVSCRHDDRSVAENSLFLHGNTDREGNCNHGVIVPQPVRLVGSTVSLESVTDIQRDANLVSENLELVKMQLEEGNLPAFITDSSNKVRWVNTAYKQMIGQPECPWLVSTMTAAEMQGNLPSTRLIGEVLLTSSAEIPVAAPAFSGRANIQWTNTGERTCMTVPCDVCRLDCCMSGGNAMSLLWKFDIDASLRLNCGR